MATEIKVDYSNKQISQDVWLKVDETGSDDICTGATVSSEQPEDGDGFWWRKVGILQLSGIFDGGKLGEQIVTLVFDAETFQLIRTEAK